MTSLVDVLKLVHISSVSENEKALADYVEQRLRSASFLDVVRLGDNVVARTRFGRARRLLIAGHLDTVPGEASAGFIEDDRLVGLGACDMKGTLAVMLDLARDPVERSVDLTWVFYAREEIARARSGLIEIAALRPELLEADAAVVGEPSGGAVEAGCQGSLRVEIVLRGVRAHSARPFTGRNAIHRSAPLLEAVARYVPRSVAIDGIIFTEQLQVVGINGGVASNVVPDEARVLINHRFAPDRNAEQASEWLRALLAPFLEDSDDFTVRDSAPSANPYLNSDAIASLVALSGGKVSGKVGWTDVATFSEWGIPAANFGAGDPLRAHRADEYVTASEVSSVSRVLEAWIA